MSAISDLTGKKFHWLTVKNFVRVNQNQKAVWACICICGKEVEVIGSHLKNGNTKSCGCYLQSILATINTTHGQARGTGKTKEYIMWKNMISRCEYKGSDDWDNYGGRGITVCERWHTFSAFFADMGPRPSGMSIDRIDVNGNYEPDNCKWSTPKEQRNNQRIKTHCQRGHPLFGENLYVHGGKRQCRICHADAQRRRMALKKEAAK